MDALVNSTLLSPRYLMKVIDEIPPQTEVFRGEEMMPLVTVPGPKVEWDVKRPLGGMTQAVARGAESPVIHRRGVGQRSFEPGHFREKVILGESDVTTLRKLGTLQDRATAAELIADIMVDLNSRLDTRIEWMRWQPIINNYLTVDSNKVKYTVRYGIPSFLRPTASPLWSVAATSDPISDIQTWLRLVRGTGGKPKKFWFNQRCEQYLFMNERILSLVDRVMHSGNMGAMGSEVLRAIIRTYIGNYEYEVYDAGYNLITYTTAAFASTSATVEDASSFAAGDVCYVSDSDENFSSSDTQYNEESLTISSISGNTITWTGSPSSSKAANSMVRCYKPFIPDNLLLIEVEFPPGSGYSGEVISVDAVYGAGSLMNPVPGKFAETLFHLDKDPKQIEIIAGINALPVLYRPRGFITATIAS